MNTLGLSITISKAYEQVKIAIDELQEKYRTVSVEIELCKRDLVDAPLAYLPLSDLKEGILQFVEASGERYAKDCIRTAISQFATNMTGSSASNEALQGKPMRFIDLQSAIDGSHGAASWFQLATPDKHIFNDQVLYYFFADLVKEGLRRTMDSMPDSAFGYEDIHPKKIGTGRLERIRMINELKERLGLLTDSQKTIRDQLKELGATPTYQKAKG